MTRDELKQIDKTACKTLNKGVKTMKHEILMKINSFEFDKEYTGGASEDIKAWTHWIIADFDINGANYKQTIQFDCADSPEFAEFDEDGHKPRVIEFLETVLAEGGKMLEAGQLEHAKELWLEKFEEREDCAEIKEKAQKMADMMTDRNEEKSLMWAVALTDAKTITILDTMIRLQIDLSVSQSQSAEIIAMFEK